MNDCRFHFHFQNVERIVNTTEVKEQPFVTRKRREIMILQRAETVLKRMVFSLASLFFSILPLPKPTRFVIITRGRTGSNLLLSLLHSHPKIRVWGEVIGEDRLREKYYQNRIRTKGAVPYVKKHLERTGFESSVGIKVLYYQMALKAYLLLIH